MSKSFLQIKQFIVLVLLFTSTAQASTTTEIVFIENFKFELKTLDRGHRSEEHIGETRYLNVTRSYIIDLESNGIIPIDLQHNLWDVLINKVDDHCIKLSNQQFETYKAQFTDAKKITQASSIATSPEVPNRTDSHLGIAANCVVEVKINF